MNKLAFSLRGAFFRNSGRKTVSHFCWNCLEARTQKGGSRGEGKTRTSSPLGTGVIILALFPSR
jgi:hypothetical protein